MARLEVSVTRPRCPYCHDEVSQGDVKVACDACMSWHHRDCWGEQGACAACGHERTSEGRVAPRPVARPPSPAPGLRGPRLAYRLGKGVGLLAELGLDALVRGAFYLTVLALGWLLGRWFFEGTLPKGAPVVQLAVMAAVLLWLGRRRRD